MEKAFAGALAFCSNFHPCRVEFEGQIFSSVEHAFVAAKTTDPELRAQVQSFATAGQVKRFGRALTLRPGWNEMRVGIMEQLLRSKFSDPKLRQLLLDTGDQPLVEVNWWHDTFWGVCNGVGENNLGKLLMKIRDELRHGQHAQKQSS